MSAPDFTPDFTKVALDLGNIDSPTGEEGPVADYVYDWLRRQGFEEIFHAGDVRVFRRR